MDGHLAYQRHIRRDKGREGGRRPGAKEDNLIMLWWGDSKFTIPSNSQLEPHQEGKEFRIDFSHPVNGEYSPR